MPITVDLPPELEQRLHLIVQQRGTTTDQYVTEVLTTALRDPEEWARLEAIDAACGALADVPGSVDDFLRERQAEADEEMRREEERYGQLRKRQT